LGFGFELKLKIWGKEIFLAKNGDR
jgi:hypothetical protein